MLLPSFFEFGIQDANRVFFGTCTNVTLLQGLLGTGNQQRAQECEPAKKACQTPQRRWNSVYARPSSTASCTAEHCKTCVYMRICMCSSCAQRFCLHSCSWCGGAVTFPDSGAELDAGLTGPMAERLHQITARQSLKVFNLCSTSPSRHTISPHQLREAIQPHTKAATPPSS